MHFITIQKAFLCKWKRVLFVSNWNWIRKWNCVHEMSAYALASVCVCVCIRLCPRWRMTSYKKCEWKHQAFVEMTSQEEIVDKQCCHWKRTDLSLDTENSRKLLWISIISFHFNISFRLMDFLLLRRRLFLLPAFLIDNHFFFAFFFVVSPCFLFNCFLALLMNKSRNEKSFLIDHHGALFFENGLWKNTRTNKMKSSRKCNTYICFGFDSVTDGVFVSFRLFSFCFSKIHWKFPSDNVSSPVKMERKQNDFPFISFAFCWWLLSFGEFSIFTICN